MVARALDYSNYVPIKSNNLIKNFVKITQIDIKKSQKSTISLLNEYQGTYLGKKLLFPVSF